MSCQDIQITFPDYLTGDLDKKSTQALQGHIVGCSSCRSELEELTGTWSKLGILAEEQPGPNLRKNFYTMLESFEEGLSRNNQQQSLSKKVANLLKKIHQILWPQQPVYQFIFTIGFLLTGFFLGSFNQSLIKTGGEVTKLRQTNQQMNQELTLALLSQPSPSKRIKGINWSSSLEEPNNKTLSALLQILNNDPNINVRLSAVDALYLFSNFPTVKSGIMASLPHQDSAMVQVALIDLLVEMREKKAAQSFRELMKRENLLPEVKERAQTGIERLL